LTKESCDNRTTPAQSAGNCATGSGDPPAAPVVTRESAGGKKTKMASAVVVATTTAVPAAKLIKCTVRPCDPADNGRTTTVAAAATTTTARHSNYPSIAPMRGNLLPSNVCSISTPQLTIFFWGEEEGGEALQSHLKPPTTPERPGEKKIEKTRFQRPHRSKMEEKRFQSRSTTSLCQ
jgi:hypothetical protein